MNSELSLFVGTLFMPQNSGRSPAFGATSSDDNIAFVPLAMPLMFGPGAIATIIGMTATIKRSPTEMLSFVAIAAAIAATMAATYVCLANAKRLTQWISPMGIDAATRIVGFFVSAIGVGLVFDGIIEVLEMHGMTTLR